MSSSSGGQVSRIGEGKSAFRSAARDDLTLSYRALASGQVDLIAGDATAGAIKGLDLVQLKAAATIFRRTTRPQWRAPALLRYRGACARAFQAA